jgi:ATP-dependent helicase YprA (DUF1998 family)
VAERRRLPNQLMLTGDQSMNAGNTPTSTISETVEVLHTALREYIEATYHVSHTALVDQRRELLKSPGVIAQVPFIESTPRYRLGQPFGRIAGLAESVLSVFGTVSQENALGDGSVLPRLVYDPPYSHQATAVEETLVNGRNVVVMTGTGSGKTESFLLPILGKTATEAAERPKAFERSAVRALILYPMNALVNDQLGRMRLLYADPRVADWFVSKSGRPMRFARYTSRTLYPGIRDKGKDQARLKPIRTYYLEHLERMEPASKQLVEALRKRGKWPAKPDLREWYGRDGSSWQDRVGNFVRCNTLPGDPELFTRHEVQAAPPDVLVTNYSMLEYMLMRPLERPIFEKTREWLQDNPDERFILVVDEAHLYRGAAGTEVALLVRRLRKRLGIPPERLQVICTSASFSNSVRAAEFGAQLTGNDASTFTAIEGSLDLRTPAAAGDKSDVESLSALSLEDFFAAESPEDRKRVVASFLEGRGVPAASVAAGKLEELLYEALHDYQPLNLLINKTMEAALSVDDINNLLFGTVDRALADRATTVLMTLAANARKAEGSPSLLPCRLHILFRGLAGLWACMDPECRELPSSQRGGPAGRLYAQPRERCRCGSRVLEFFTCRQCGSAYARAYTDQLESPSFLWSEPGQTLEYEGGTTSELQPLDLLLEEPAEGISVEPADYDLTTGRLNSLHGDRTRSVFLRPDRWIEVASNRAATDAGQFVPCGVCGEQATFGRSSVQDHQTKGDEPFRALVTAQLQVQPPSPKAATRLAPHRGRKVLIFSDSRQTAARLAPNLQEYSNRDVLRPLLFAGFAELNRFSQIFKRLSLNDSYFAVLLVSAKLGVRLRPELRLNESFDGERKVDEAVRGGLLADADKLFDLWIESRDWSPPAALMKALSHVLTHRYYGMESLALGSFCGAPRHHEAVRDLPTLGKGLSEEQKFGLVNFWLSTWAQQAGIWLRGFDASVQNNDVQGHSGRFAKVGRVLDSWALRKEFERAWLPELLNLFCESIAGEGKYRLRGGELSIDLGGDWQACGVCRNTQRPILDLDTCRQCGSPRVQPVDPNEDPVFTARNGYYRQSTLAALKGKAPLAIIAAEHTAQLGDAQSQEVYSKAEEHELLFQDVELGPDERGKERPAIDVLSCTTTMEVGIDIGTLSGVALRNMPPTRANYQQRSGRAGRRGHAVATVIAMASADSHDEHFFSDPAAMIRGEVDDPTLTLNNVSIARRHVTAFLLQRYLEDRLPANPTDFYGRQLFEVLGTVDGFLSKDAPLNRNDFALWLGENVEGLQRELQDWLPHEIGEETRQHLMAGVVDSTIAEIDSALGLGEVGDND